MTNDTLNEEDLFSRESTITPKGGGNKDDFNERVKTDIWKFMAEEIDTPYFGSALVDLKRTLYAETHFVKGIGDQLCFKTQVLSGIPFWKDKEAKIPNDIKCIHCESPDTFEPIDKKTGNKRYNRPNHVCIIPFYSYDSVNRVITPKDKKTGEHRKDDSGEIIKFNDQPQKGLILKRGTEDLNLTPLVDLDNEGELCSKNTVLEYRRYDKSLKKSPSLIFANKVIADKKFKSIGGCNVPKDIQELWDSRSNAEIRGLLVNLLPFQGMWDNPAIKKFCVKPESNVKSDEPDASAELDN